jgi:hypothetical protein
MASRDQIHDAQRRRLWLKNIQIKQCQAIHDPDPGYEILGKKAFFSHLKMKSRVRLAFNIKPRLHLRVWNGLFQIEYHGPLCPVSFHGSRRFCRVHVLFGSLK